MWRCWNTTAALAIGGYTTAATDDVESWDGTSWTEITDMNSAKDNTTSGNGTMAQSNALCFTGGPGHVATNEFWNGSAWTELNDLSQGRNGATGSGTSVAALCAGGYHPSPGVLDNTEEFTADVTNTTITSS